MLWDETLKLMKHINRKVTNHCKWFSCVFYDIVSHFVSVTNLLSTQLKTCTYSTRTEEWFISHNMARPRTKLVLTRIFHTSQGLKCRPDLLVLYPQPLQISYQSNKSCGTTHRNKALPKKLHHGKAVRTPKPAARTDWLQFVLGEGTHFSVVGECV